ncbi:hypothetical protein GCK72_005008 [Caenorhabditis remanei]|uniref:Uncharacterized protein n=1 Tax=Caenorhabditis remanei TaxID=31234 RepID=A0A6A5HD23_CAERE|nr:hypothetical protein GCK72_005008 [Caenorhabditis remanei]KAF1765057.1 hypothetical protein GCK72_005008 [Caenorhabditis remanei]
MPTAIIPQIEDVRWIGTIPTGSSMCRRSRSGRTAIEKTDEMEPMTRACHGRETAQIAGITWGSFFVFTKLIVIAVAPPPIEAIIVATAARAPSLHRPPVIPQTDPALIPNHPHHNRNVPNNAFVGLLI